MLQHYLVASDECEWLSISPLFLHRFAKNRKPNWRSIVLHLLHLATWWYKPTSHSSHWISVLRNMHLVFRSYLTLLFSIICLHPWTLLTYTPSHQERKPWEVKSLSLSWVHLWTPPTLSRPVIIARLRGAEESHFHFQESHSPLALAFTSFRPFHVILYARLWPSPIQRYDLGTWCLSTIPFSITGMQPYHVRWVWVVD